MAEQFHHLTDQDLGFFLEVFPIDAKFEVPVLTRESDILELHRRLVRPQDRWAGYSQLDKVYQPFQDSFSPRPAKEFMYDPPYCKQLEGERGEGWKSLVYRGRLVQVAGIEKLLVKQAVYGGHGNIMDARLVDSAGVVIMKQNWNSKKVSQAGGCYFDQNKKPFIVSPPVIAVTYGKHNWPHFFYDRRRLKRRGPDQKADGFVWLVRPAKLDAITKAVMKRFINEESNIYV